MGRASEGRDFVPLMDSVVFMANQSEANITLRVLDDEDPERDESVFVMLVGVQLIEGEQARPSKTLTQKLFLTLQMNQLQFTFFQFSAPHLWARGWTPLLK